MAKAKRIETGNREWGFFGTIERAAGDDRRGARSARARAAVDYDAAAHALMAVHGVDAAAAVAFLDSQAGRHLADEVAGCGKTIDAAVRLPWVRKGIVKALDTFPPLPLGALIGLTLPGSGEEARATVLAASPTRLLVRGAVDGKEVEVLPAYVNGVRVIEEPRQVAITRATSRLIRVSFRWRLADAVPTDEALARNYRRAAMRPLAEVHAAIAAAYAVADARGAALPAPTVVGPHGAGLRETTAAIEFDVRGEDEAKLVDEILHDAIPAPVDE